MRRARDERRAVPSLRVGFVPGVTLTKWRRIWSERFPRLALEIVEVTEAEQREAITQEQVDRCFVRLPVVDAGLHVIPLYGRSRWSSRRRTTPSRCSTRSA